MKKILLLSTYSNQPKQFNQSLNQLKNLYNKEIQNSNESNKIKLHKSNAIEGLINYYKMLEQKSKRGNDTGNINNQNGLNILNDLDNLNNFKNLEVLLNEATVHFVDLINNKNNSDNTESIESIESIENKEDIINMYKKMNSSNIYDIHRIAHSHKPSSLSKEELDMFLTGVMYFLTLEYNNFKNINK